MKETFLRLAGATLGVSPGALMSVWILAAFVSLATARADDSPEAAGRAGSRATARHLTAAERMGFEYAPKDLPVLSEAADAKPAPFVGEIAGEGILPRMVISADRVHLNSEEILTDKGRLEVAQKRHLTPLYRATLGPLSVLAGYYMNPFSLLGGWHPNEAEAMILYRQEEKLQRRDEMDSLIRLEEVGARWESKEDQRLRKEMRQSRYNFLPARQ
jgi:hypothetical protein